MATAPAAIHCRLEQRYMGNHLSDTAQKEPCCSENHLQRLVQRGEGIDPRMIAWQGELRSGLARLEPLQQMLVEASWMSRGAGLRDRSGRGAASSLLVLARSSDSIRLDPFLPSMPSLFAQRSISHT